MTDSSPIAADRLAEVIAREPTLIELWSSPFLIGMTLALLGAGLLTLVLAVRWSHDARSFGPESRRFCRAIGLTRRERSRFAQLARVAGLPDAVTLIASRGAFEHALRVAVSGNMNWNFDDLRAVHDRLHENLTSR